MSRIKIAEEPPFWLAPEPGLAHRSLFAMEHVGSTA